MTKPRGTLLFATLALASLWLAAGGCSEQSSTDPVSSGLAPSPDEPIAFASGRIGGAPKDPLPCDGSTQTFNSPASGTHEVTGYGGTPNQAVNGAILEVIEEGILSQFECEPCDDPERACEKFVDIDSVDLGGGHSNGALTSGFGVWSYTGTVTFNPSHPASAKAGCRCEESDE